MNAPPIDQQVTFLYTRNLAQTASFYEDVLGLTLVLDQGSCRIYRVAGDAFVGFCQREEAPERPAGIIFTLVTQEVDAWYDHLQEKGVLIEKAPEVNAAYNIRHCFLRDPNGYLIEIQSFLDPRWPTPGKYP
ncbi:MAG: VOC family protein [Caldilineaceae bacterium]|nr:VOC family protein [Caldilineaceae bacterium]